MTAILDLLVAYFFGIMTGAALMGWWMYDAMSGPEDEI